MTVVTEETWIEAASPSYPCVIDRDHVTAELYHLVNVPSAVWIDESGRIVRPPEPAGMTDAFRAMDRGPFALPQSAREERDRAKATYLEAVRDWAVRGAASPHVLGADVAKARMRIPDAAVAEAHARFRLGQALLREGLRADRSGAPWRRGVSPQRLPAIPMKRSVGEPPSLLGAHLHPLPGLPDVP